MQVSSKISIRIGNYKHGYRKTKIYNVWRNMKSRCYNKHDDEYKNYGERGISVCEEWLNPKTFCDWCVANGWSNYLQMDRIDNNGNYEPNNIQFVSVKINNGVGRRSLVNKSGFIGVCYKPENGKWAAYIKFNGKNINLGYYNELKDAAYARKTAEIKYFGEYKTEFLNKPRISFEFGEMEKAE